MRQYREQLRPPASYWVLGLLTAATLATTLWAGLPLAAAVVIYVVFCGGCALALLAWGQAVIEVADGRLRAGRDTLPLSQAGQVAALDEAQVRALRGPRADPAALLIGRPYLKLAVYVEVAGPPAGPPYWLVGTRHPAELAAAIERSRPASRPESTSVG